MSELGSSGAFVAVVVSLLFLLGRAGGRMAPKAALAPLAFLVSRRPVLLAWGAGAAGMFLWLHRMAVAHGHGAPADQLELAGVSLLCGGGFAVMAVGFPFMVARAFARPPAFRLEEGEEVLRSYLANHFLGGEARGGKLLVTSRRLGFRPHRFNIQLDTWSVRLDEVRGLATHGDRMLLVEGRKPGQPDWFVIMRPKAVAQLVEELRPLSEAERAKACA